MALKQALPLEHWGLERWPFPTTPAPDQLYPTACHTEALARIDYLVESRRRLGVLVGELGVGKTQALHAAARQLARKQHAVVLLEAIGTSVREFLWQAAAALGASPRDDADVAKLWRLLTDRVLENRLQNVPTVLLVDDAEQAGPDLMTQFARLTRIDPSPAARWTIVLAAQPIASARWGESLRSAIDLKIEMGPWTLEETTGFLQTSLVDAGRFEPVFTEAALTTIHELSQGVPRQVARLADLALLAGAAAELELVDADTIQAAGEETTWPSAAETF